MDHELLQAIQDIYRSIKRRNLYLQRLHESVGFGSLDNLTAAEFQPCQMVKAEDRVLEGMIPGTIQKLKAF